jgi:hypothetical protein
MTREQFVRDAHRQLEQEFQQYLAADLEAMRQAARTHEEIEAKREFAWRDFEEVRHQLVCDAWKRFRAYQPSVH